MRRNYIIATVVIGLIAVALIVRGVPGNRTSNLNTAGAKHCADEVKICADGNVVSRVPPRCDFAACSATEATTATDEWTEFVDAGRGLTLRHPPDWTATPSDEAIVLAGPGLVPMTIRRVADDTPVYESANHHIITVDGVSGIQADMITPDVTTRTIWIQRGETWLTFAWPHGDNDRPYYQVISTITWAP